MRVTTTTLLILLLAASTSVAQSDATRIASLEALPVDHVMAFKDGHALVVHEAEVAVGEDGVVRIGELPRPILGTFWAWVTDEDVRIAAVVAGRRPVEKSRTITDIIDLVAANTGRRVQVTDKDGNGYAGTLLGMPRDGKTRAAFVLIETLEGVHATPADRIRDVTFLDGHTTEHVVEEMRETLAIHLDREGGAVPEKVTLGMAYVQKGVKWIPSYKIDIDGAGKARMTLRASIINDLHDLADATVHVVIGAPKFDYAHLNDPIALQDVVMNAAAQTYDFNNPIGNNRFSNMVSFDNGLQSQRAAYEPVGPAVTDAKGSEDLFVYTLDHVTLAAGERMIVDVSSFELAYEDVYTVALPALPPQQILRGQSLPEEVLRAARNPLVTHKLRLTNASGAPLTTAPATIMLDGRILAQTTMTYTAAGSRTDISLNTAVDIRVRKTEKEAGREGDATLFDGDYYHRIDFAGTIHATNMSSRKIRLEIKRYVMGHVSEAKGGGEAAALSMFDEELHDAVGGPQHGRPSWWNHVNGVARIVWTTELEPGKSFDHDYLWYYYWR